MPWYLPIKNSLFDQVEVSHKKNCHKIERESGRIGMYSNWISIKILLSIVKLILCLSHSASDNDFQCVKYTVPNCSSFGCQSIDVHEDEPYLSRHFQAVFIPGERKENSGLLIVY